MTNRFINKTAEEAVDILLKRYAEVQSEKKAEMSPELKNTLIGGAVGAGVGGLGSLGYNYLKNKRLNNK